MNNEEMIKELVKQKQESRETIVTRQEDVGVKKLIICLKGSVKYAFYAVDIREIVIDNAYFPIPFVPDYVRGLINRHGEPFTVIDIGILFVNETYDDNKYLIMNITDDQLAFMITDIVEICNIPENELHPLQSTDDNNKYFTASFTNNDEEIFIINLHKIRERLEHDVQTK